MNDGSTPTVTLYNRAGEACVVDAADVPIRLAAGYTAIRNRSDITVAQTADTELVPAIAPHNPAIVLPDATAVAPAKRGPGRPKKQ